MLTPPVEIVEIFLLALASMVWPALIAVVVVALASREPVRLLAWFLAGALLTTVSIGTLIVLVLQKTEVLTGSRHTVSAAVDLAVGAAALLAALLVRRRERAAPPDPRRHGSSWSERTLTRGGALAFVVGIVFNVFPGVLPFVALKNIADLNYAAGASIALVIGFYLVMFLPAEVPLGGYLVLPERTTAAVGRFNTWLERNARSLAVYVLTAAGIYLIVRGVVSL